MTAETLRQAAALMRERAEAAGVPWHPWGDETLPQREGPQAWADDMDGYLGGEWGVHAGSWHPAVALAVADWLDSEANTADETARNDGLPPDYLYVGPAMPVALAYLGTDA